MKSNRDSGDPSRRKEPARSGGKSATGPSSRRSPDSVFALGFGLFLGLAILKFGNPVILDQKITAPANFAEAWSFAWPVHWAYGLLLAFMLAGLWLVIPGKPPRPRGWSLWVLPGAWFGWQLVSATGSVDAQLTTTVLWHFGGCLACYFAGALLFARQNVLRWLLIGLMAAFAFCLVRAVNQRLFEFPQERRLLLEGERTGWTNFPPEVLLEMKQDSVVIASNGIDVANPVILAKYGKEPAADTSRSRRMLLKLGAPTPRVMGTLVYPNALAGLVLLLWPLSLVLAINQTRRFSMSTRMSALFLTLFLGGAGLFWTGSKLGWLIAVMLAGIGLLRSNWASRWKYPVLALVIVGGLTVFAVRFHSYFAAGATSMGARFDYWRAALKITAEHPWLGSGPGTFQRTYAEIKSPDAEMARLVHNDYLEQFSDSGIPGGVSYSLWILVALSVTGKRLWRSTDPLPFAVFMGLLGWFAQGLGEFGLYIPALAWSAFTLLGWLAASSANQIDKSD